MKYSELTKKNYFIRGMASALDLFGIAVAINPPKRFDVRNDAKAIAGDWARVGMTLSRSMNTYKQAHGE